MENLKLELEQRVAAGGADLFTVADLLPSREQVLATGGEIPDGFTRTVSAAIRLSDAIVDGIAAHEDPRKILIYNEHIYEVVNRLLNQMALRVTQVLQSHGFQACPVSASQTLNLQEQTGLFSHKMAAHLGGLGWIGKNCLFVTRSFGPRVRLATVLTDAPLPAPAASHADLCGTCDLCVRACPAGALTGRTFRPEEPRSVRLDAGACFEYTAERRRNWGLQGFGNLCGLCMQACPFGRTASGRLRVGFSGRERRAG